MRIDKEHADEVIKKIIELAEKGAPDNVLNMYAIRFGIESVHNADDAIHFNKNKDSEEYKEIMKGIPAGCFDIGQGARSLTKDDGFLDPEYNGNMDFFFILEDLMDEYSKMDGDYTDDQMKTLYEELVKLFRKYHFYNENE